MYNIKYSVYEHEDLNDSKVFQIKELMDILKTKGLKPERIVFINSIFVSENQRNQGIATSLLKKIISENKGSIILMEAYASKDEYPVQPSEYEYPKILMDLDRLFTRNGFYDINDLVGRFDYKKLYIYDEFYKNVIFDIKEES